MDEIYQAIEEGPIGVKLLEKGKAQGINEGIHTGEKRAVTLLWQKRFGPLAPDVTAALDSATEAELHSLLETLAGTPTGAEAWAILGLS